MRRLLILMYGRRRKRLRQWMHGVGVEVGVAPSFLSLGVCPPPLFHLSCTFGVSFAFGFLLSSMFSRVGLIQIESVLFLEVD